MTLTVILLMNRGSLLRGCGKVHVLFTRSKIRVGLHKKMVEVELPAIQCKLTKTK